MARKKLTYVPEADAPKNITDDFDSFMQKSTGITVRSLKDGGKIPYWINTNCYALNWIISNDFFKGIPGTVNVLISGDPGKGKSFLCDVILGNNVRMGGKSYKVDIEKSANYDFTTQIVGSKEIAEQIRIIKPEDGKVISIERLSAILNKAIDYQASAKAKKNPSVLFVVDSVTQLTTDKEMDIVKKRDEKKKDKKDMTAAVKMRELFRTIEQKQEFSNVTIVGIAQLTANITTGFTPPGTPTKVANVKGSGFAFASSLTIQMVSDKEIKVKEIPIGIKMKMKTTKNRIKYKGRDCFIYFYFKHGVDPLGGLIELLHKYGVIKASKAPSKGGEFPPGTTFKYKNNGNEVEFTMKSFKKIVEENGGEEFLKELNAKMNEKYEMILDQEGIDEDELLEEDGIEDEEGEEEEDE